VVALVAVPPEVDVVVVADVSVVTAVALVSVELVEPESVATVAAVSVAPLVTELSVTAVSVFAASSFLQLMAKMLRASRATRVITRDFFIEQFSFEFFSGRSGLNR